MYSVKTVHKANVALSILFKYAKAGKKLTYTELSDELNKYPNLTPSYRRSLGYVLKYIREEVCKKKGLPQINIIVIKKKTDALKSGFLVIGK